MWIIVWIFLFPTLGVGGESETLYKFDSKEACETFLRDYGGTRVQDYFRGHMNVGPNTPVAVQGSCQSKGDPI